MKNYFLLKKIQQVHIEKSDRIRKKINIFATLKEMMDIGNDHQ